MKWNWQDGLGCHMLSHSTTKIGDALSLKAESNAGQWGDSTGVVVAFCHGLYLILRSRTKPSPGTKDM
jgi:hypothetical protein